MPNASGEVSGSQSGRIYSVDGKGVPLQARPNGGGADGAATGLYAVPFDCDVIITENSIRCQRRDKKHSTVQGSHVNFEDGKSQTLSVAHTPKVIEPIEYNPLQSCNVVVTDQNIRCTYKDGSGTAQGYTVYFDDVKGPSVIAGHAHKMKIIEPATGKEWPVYEVRDGQITIKEKQYPIKLADGFYIIRKLTVTECKRLQTVPEDYIFPVSDTQAYKMLGNGWTVDVIAHILHYAPGITTEPLEVLSMYDGMSCGHLALDKLKRPPVGWCPGNCAVWSVRRTCRSRLRSSGRYAPPAYPAPGARSSWWTLEVNRLCTDGTKNACSMLYAAAWRAARAMGYKRLVTYMDFRLSGLAWSVSSAASAAGVATLSSTASPGRLHPSSRT